LGEVSHLALIAVYEANGITQVQIVHSILRSVTSFQYNVSHALQDDVQEVSDQGFVLDNQNGTDPPGEV
jgi:hypothetical protein